MGGRGKIGSTSASAGHEPECDKTSDTLASSRGNTLSTCAHHTTRHTSETLVVPNVHGSEERYTDLKSGAENRFEVGGRDGAGNLRGGGEGRGGDGDGGSESSSRYGFSGGGEGEGGMFGGGGGGEGDEVGAFDEAAARWWKECFQVAVRVCLRVCVCVHRLWDDRDNGS